jgi:hypothetical protein
MGEPLIQSKLHHLVFYRNEKARAWAERYVNRGDGRTPEQEYASRAEAMRKDHGDVPILVIHPSDDPEDVPIDFEGVVSQFSLDDLEQYGYFPRD